MTTRADFDLEREGTPGRAAIVNGLLAVVILLVILQLWLVTVALDLFLVGSTAGPIQLAAVSGLLFLLSLGALLVVRR